MKTKFLYRKTRDTLAGVSSRISSHRQFELDSESIINMNSSHTGQNSLLKFNVSHNGYPINLDGSCEDRLKNIGVEMSILKLKKSYLIEIDNVKIEWEGDVITGLKLKELAGVCPFDYAILQKNIAIKDRLIKNNEVIFLNNTCCCDYYTIPFQTKAGDVTISNLLPSQDVMYLEKYSYDIIVDKQKTGLVLYSFDLPPERFDHSSTDILILLPSGYPDVPPDMFYCKPWIRYSKTDSLPTCADVGFSFNNEKWQRWSRHNNIWYPGKDGIETMIKRVQSSLEET